MSKEKVANEENLNLNFGFDENKMPVHIEWISSQDAENKAVECKAILLSMFDKEHRDTYKIDLWTTEMQVAEMDRFMYQTLRGLAETYHNATKNSALSNDFMRFTQYFGEKTEVIPKS
jgi:gliding motility-associated protein GldC